MKDGVKTLAFVAELMRKPIYKEYSSDMKVAIYENAMKNSVVNGGYLCPCGRRSASLWTRWN